MQQCDLLRLLDTQIHIIGLNKRNLKVAFAKKA